MSETRQDTEVKTAAQQAAPKAKKPAAKPTAAASAKTAAGKTEVKKSTAAAGEKPAAKKTASGTAKSASAKAAGAKKSGTAASAKPAKTAEKKGSAQKKQSSVDKNAGTAAVDFAKQMSAKGGELFGKAKNALDEAAQARREKAAEKPPKKPLSKKEKRRRKKLIGKIIRRTLLCFFTLLLLAVFGVYMVMYTVFHGPSQNACDLLVNSLLETSALKFVPRLYFSEEEVQAIVERNAVKAPDEDTDTSLIVIDRTPKTEGEGGSAVEEKDIEIVEVSGATYHGYMMIVQDPSRVTLAVCDPGFDSSYGKYLDEMAIENGAVAAINAGGFEDEGGSGRGGKPLGIVVKDGKVLNSRRSRECSIVIGFDKDDKLIVGDMTADEAIERGMRDAASFDPVLILNGEPAEVSGSSSGLNPRTAIGQRADGAVLLLVIDGRQVNSMGASLADLIDVMMQFGAVNAANLDGGSSSKMWYQGEFVNDGVALTGSRRLPTAFIVK